MDLGCSREVEVVTPHRNSSVMYLEHTVDGKLTPTVVESMAVQSLRKDDWACTSLAKV